MNSAPKGTQITVSLLTILSIGACGFVLIRDNTNFQRISALASLVSLLAMLYYSTNGFRKAEAKYFRITLLCAAAAEFFAQIPHLNTPVIKQFAFTFIGCVYMAVFGVYLSLGIGYDVGEKVSVLLASIVAILKVVIAALAFYAVFFAQRTELDMLRALRTAASAGIAIGIFICVHGKYADKTRRHAE